MNIMNEQLISTVSYVMNSRYRKRVIQLLSRHTAMIPSKISEEATMLPNYGSKIISDLKKEGLIECINPEVKKGRLYKLTATGKSVAKYL